jgi:hypothetical protein
MQIGMLYSLNEQPEIRMEVVETRYGKAVASYKRIQHIEAKQSEKSETYLTSTVD